MNQSIKTLIIWVVLIAIFIAVYDLNQSGRGSVAALVLFVGLLVVVGVGIFFGRRAQRGNRTNQEGIKLLDSGRLVAASEKFELAAQQLGNNAYVARFNLGLARLRLWQLEAAVEALQSAQGRAAKAKNLELPQFLYLALALALLGRTAEARAALEKLQGEPDGLQRITRAVLAARAGDFEAAFDEASRHEVKLLGGSFRGLAEAIRAWARLQTKGDRWPVDRIALFGEAGPELLQRAWPELVAFVEQAPS